METKLKHHSSVDRSKKSKLLNYVALVYLFYFYLPFNNDLKKIKSYRSKFNFLCDLINISGKLWICIHTLNVCVCLRLDTYFSFPFRRLSQKVLCCAWEFFYLCLCARVKWMVKNQRQRNSRNLGRTGVNGKSVSFKVISVFPPILKREIYTNRITSANKYMIA